MKHYYKDEKNNTYCLKLEYTKYEEFKDLSLIEITKEEYEELTYFDKDFYGDINNG